MPEQQYITVEGLFTSLEFPEFHQQPGRPQIPRIPFTGQLEPGLTDLVKVNFECRCGGHEEPAWVVRYHVSAFLNSLDYNFNDDNEVDIWVNSCPNCDPQPEQKTTAVGAGV